LKEKLKAKPIKFKKLFVFELYDFKTASTCVYQLQLAKKFSKIETFCKRQTNSRTLFAIFRQKSEW